MKRILLYLGILYLWKKRFTYPRKKKDAPPLDDFIIEELKKEWQNFKQPFQAIKEEFRKYK